MSEQVTQHELVLTLARRLRETVLPELGAHGGRKQLAPESGGVVSDGWGRALDDQPLFGSGHDLQMSSISAASKELHELLVDAIHAGIERLPAVFG